MVGGAEVLPPLAAAEGLNIATVGAHQKILRVHAGYALVHLVKQRLVERVMRRIHVDQVPQRSGQFKTAFEDFLFDGLLQWRFPYALGVGAEKFKVFTKIEEIEQYRCQLSRVDSMVNPPECSHVGHDLINNNRIGQFRKQL
jgi:hypothetical protein